MNKPIDQSHWIKEGAFLAGEYPRNLDEEASKQKLKKFVDFGINSFVDLTEENELEPYENLLQEMDQNAVAYKRFLIRDVSVPENKNEVAAKTQFEKRVLEAKKSAIEENKKLAKETGNKLTQNINKDGQLVGINNTIESVLGNKEEVTSADIRKELFEGGNVPTGAAVQDAINRGLTNASRNTETENIKVEISEKQEDKSNKD